RAFPYRPGLGGLPQHLLIGTRETRVVSADHVCSLACGNGLDVALTQVGVERGGAAGVLIEPLDLPAAQQKNAPENQLADLVRMSFRVGERKGRAPRAAEDEPALDGQVLAQ